MHPTFQKGVEYFNFHIPLDNKEIISLNPYNLAIVAK